MSGLRNRAGGAGPIAEAPEEARAVALVGGRRANTLGEGS